MSTFSAYQHIFLRELTVFENYGTLNTVRVIKGFYMLAKYRGLYKGFSQRVLNNDELVDLCQYMLDTETPHGDKQLTQLTDYLLEEGFLYDVPVEEVAHTDPTAHTDTV